ncbi:MULTISPECIES: hypothetical protein [unclassified Streptomyces]|uniref:hypothetical protein n=1 Tax=unclassified Streptomyces TaxID=2593676 RepID=UPI003246B6E5
MGMLDATTLEVTVDYGTFGLVDMECAGGTYNLDDPEAGAWLRTDVGMVYPDLVSNVAFIRLRLESWASEPPQEGVWSRVEVTEVEMPSGVLGIEVIAAGFEEDVFALPGPGAYRLRVAFCVSPETAPFPLRREQARIQRAYQGHEEDLRDVDEYFRVQYWPA